MNPPRNLAWACLGQRLMEQESQANDDHMHATPNQSQLPSSWPPPAHPLSAPEQKLHVPCLNTSRQAERRN